MWKHFEPYSTKSNLNQTEICFPFSLTQASHIKAVVSFYPEISTGFLYDFSVLHVKIPKRFLGEAEGEQEGTVLADM